ncbi:MAG: hypothetical protein P8N02_19335 [Actinomycetota bacterium]|nr:hypothetical protein [Actinomycetota bacterium]
MRPRRSGIRQARPGDRAGARLFFIDIQTRTASYAGITTNPTGARTTRALVGSTRCGGLINEYRNAA